MNGYHAERTADQTLYLVTDQGNTVQLAEPYTSEDARSWCRLLRTKYSQCLQLHSLLYLDENADKVEIKASFLHFFQVDPNAPWLVGFPSRGRRFIKNQCSINVTRLELFNMEDL